MGRVRIGISGWNYSAWRSDFYPDDLRRKRELEYASRIFDTIEVNGTFYGLSTPDAFRSWYRTAPADFVYAVKGSRFITHNKKLRDARGPLANFFASGVLELDDKLGPILWQLPASLRFDADRIDSFLELLPRTTDEAADLARTHDDRVKKVGYGPGTTRRLRHVLEVRHDSWLCDELVRILRRHGVALAFSHASTFPYVEEITAGFVYVRLHGPERIYESAYGHEWLARWADRVRAWHRAEEPCDAARITDRSPPARKERDVYVYFDNDARGIAPREAKELMDLVA